MSKLYRARSLLHRRQILQVNIRWKALDEIYKIYMLLHRSDLNISENVQQFFFAPRINRVDLVKSFPTNIFLQNLASIQKRTSPKKFAHLAETSENASISNLSTKAQPAGGTLPRGGRVRPQFPACRGGYPAGFRHGAQVSAPGGGPNSPSAFPFRILITLSTFSRLCSAVLGARTPVRSSSVKVGRLTV